MKTLTIDIPPGEVQAYLAARRKRQEDRLNELKYITPLARMNWFCLVEPKGEQGSRAYKNARNRYVELFLERQALLIKLYGP